MNRENDMRLLLTILIAAHITWCAHAQEEPGAGGEKSTAAVTLRADSSCSTDYVLLGGIAQFSGFDGEMEKKLAAVSVAKAPLPGATRSYTHQEVLASLKRAGINQELALHGKQVTVTATAETIKGSTLSEAVQQSIQNHYQADADMSAEVEITTPAADLIVRIAEHNLEVEVPSGGFRPGSQRVKVRVMHDGKRLAEGNVGVNVRVTGNVVVAAGRIAGDDILQESDLKQVRRELTAADLKSRDDARKLIGMRAKRAIAADEVLVKSMFAMPQVIKRGDLVTIFVRRGNLELATRGEARSDAVLDERVRVLVLDNDAEVNARASGPREATIDDPNPKAQTVYGARR
jgi:flagellar basal body P-ring formation protein FlgA